MNFFGKSFLVVAMLLVFSLFAYSIYLNQEATYEQYNEIYELAKKDAAISLYVQQKLDFDGLLTRDTAQKIITGSLPQEVDPRNEVKKRFENLQ